MDATAANLTIQELGEQGLLKRLQQFCPAPMVGDDAALLSLQGNGSLQASLVVTADMLVDRVHFSERTTSPADAGWRAAAANLSDLAAMGAMPLGITVSLGLPGDLAVFWVEQLYQGMVACLDQFNTPIVGGDICRSPTITVAIAAFGQVPPQRAIRRSTAQPGDVILVTGVHGASRAGLELLLHPDQGLELTECDRQALIQKHQRPVPRLDLIPILNQLVTDSEDWTRFPIAGMDSSDGLADAVLQICQASGVGAELDRAQIPMPSEILNWVSPQQAIEWALYGGEDFELVLCLPLSLAERFIESALHESVSHHIVVIGEITRDRTVTLIDSQGHFPPEVLTLERGFQHF